MNRTIQHLLGLGKHREAVEACETAIAHNPSDLEGWMELGLAKLVAGDCDGFRQVHHQLQARLGDSQQGLGERARRMWSCYQAFCGSVVVGTMAAGMITTGCKTAPPPAGNEDVVVMATAVDSSALDASADVAAGELVAAADAQSDQDSTDADDAARADAKPKPKPAPKPQPMMRYRAHPYEETG